MSFMRCPRCSTQLPAAGTEVLVCSGCRREYPLALGIPLLFAEPEAHLARWAAGLHHFVQETDRAIAHVFRDSLDAALNGRTRERLRLVADGLVRHRDTIVALFHAANIDPLPGPAGCGAADILAYYSLVHRDWAWPPEYDEVTPAVDALLAVLPAGFTLGRTLVLGAGTARLAWELGNRLQSDAPLVALDVNPLPLFVTQQLMGGATVPVVELPGHPRRSTFAAKEHTLLASAAAPPGLTLVFADGLDPPFAPGSFDTIITPWFVDQVPQDLAELPALIHRLLRPRGTWLNQGPFVYDPERTQPAHRYCADEFLQLVGAAGFKVTRATYEACAYMASPLSAQARSEWVLTMHATAGEAPQACREDPQPWPDAADDRPLQRLDGLDGYRAPHPTITAVARLIDGRRSRADLCRELIAEGVLADDNSADAAVLACLKVIASALADSPQ